MYGGFHGKFYEEGHIVAVYDLKKDAEKDIKKDGYKFNKEQGLFINPDYSALGEARWYRIEKIAHNTL